MGQTVGEMAPSSLEATRRWSIPCQSLTLRPVGSLSRPRRPLSRGSSPAGCPTEPLVSYRINRQFSGWNLPPLIIRAFGAHGHKETYAAQQNGPRQMNFGPYPRN